MFLTPATPDDTEFLIGQDLFEQFIACDNHTQSPPLFQNIFKLCTFLPKFSNILPFLPFYCPFSEISHA